MTATLDIALRPSAGLAFGALIGFERQWSARTAGLRTNALLSLGSALFVIMKQGASISGLNIAATLRASAAVVAPPTAVSSGSAPLAQRP